MPSAVHAGANDHRQCMSMISDDEIVQAVFMLLRQRGPAASICPSDAARSLAAAADGWRALMPRVRELARAEARAGRLRITQGPRTLDPEQPVRGAIRLRLPPA
jgi:hypothetical protein